MVKNLPDNAEDTKDTNSIPGSGRSPGVGDGNTPARENPRIGEPGRLQSMGSQRVGLNSAHRLSSMKYMSYNVYNIFNFS